jgi:glycosyltransferase involved in cell wall biosynthesis
MKTSSKIFIISGINIFQGGALSVFKDCLNSIDNSEIFQDVSFLALVHSKSSFSNFKRIKLIEITNSRKSYFHRLFYEYFYFKSLAARLNVDFWFSLHDITPNIGKIKKAVYCHNPSPFYRVNFRDLFYQPKQFFFSLLYFYLYKTNLQHNNFVIVQQNWIANKFLTKLKVPINKILVANPRITKVDWAEFNNKIQNIETNGLVRFFYPTFPRVFKNIEAICKASKELSKAGITNFEVLITISGAENNYSKRIFQNFKNIKNLKFIGQISRESVFSIYKESDFLIFPSKMETWGLPLSEYSQLEKPIIVSDLPYAHETLNNYERILFFPPDDVSKLTTIMKNCIQSYDNLKFDTSKPNKTKFQKVESWEELIHRLIEC